VEWVEWAAVVEVADVEEADGSRQDYFAYLLACLLLIASPIFLASGLVFGVRIFPVHSIPLHNMTTHGYDWKLHKKLDIL
jgi:hypothetical protein